MASTTVAKQPQPHFMTTTRRDMLRVFVIGAITGLLAAAFYMLIDSYVLSAKFCAGPGSSAAGCANRETYIGAFALVISALVAVIALVRARVYRPLLVAILAVASLWGVMQLLAELPRGWMFTASIVLAALAYTAFTWLLLIRKFLIALIVGIIVVVLLRIVLMA